MAPKPDSLKELSPKLAKSLKDNLVILQSDLRDHKNEIIKHFATSFSTESLKKIFDEILNEKNQKIIQLKSELKNEEDLRIDAKIKGKLTQNCDGNGDKNNVFSRKGDFAKTCVFVRKNVVFSCLEGTENA